MTAKTKTKYLKMFEICSDYKQYGLEVFLCCFKRTKFQNYGFFAAHGCGDGRVFVDRRVGQEEPGRVQGLRLTRSL
jgi:hypothetical protein